MRRALSVNGQLGRPLWPVPATTMLGAFYAGRPLATRVTVLCLHVDLMGWRMAARLAPGPPALRAGGSWANTLPRCHAPWMTPLPSADSDLLVVLHSFAATAALAAARDAGLVQGRVLLVRGPCAEALDGLRRGDFRRPAAQDGALLFGAACLDLGLDPPHFVPLPAALAARGERPSMDLECDTSSGDLPPARRRQAHTRRLRLIPHHTHRPLRRRGPGPARGGPRRLRPA
jgi:hypothetical protein